jgi:RHS repeat-associated protein
MEHARESGPGTSGADQSFLVKAPEISMPKGGGAIRGLGEKFAANPATGSAKFSIPIPLPPGRSGFGPELTLNYDSAMGNGPFGFGWHLGLPSITRRTDRGLPRYDDRADTFLIAGAEDLVPVLNAAGAIDDDEASVQDYVIRRYRPRVEGLFSRIERWTHRDGDTHWRSISPDNVLTVYGKTDAHRIHDPIDPSRVFTWLVSESRDVKGNAIIFDYKSEDGTDVDASQAHEHHRGPVDDASRTANRYLSGVRYGNVSPLLDTTSFRRPRFLSHQEIDATSWMFEAVFDYGQADRDRPDQIGTWIRRADPFSSYRAGFEVRTYRLCHRVLVFHNFPDDPVVGDRCLVRSIDFSYRTTPQDSDSSNPGYSFLQGAMKWSYQRHADVWHRRAFPPVEFTYSEARIDDRVRDVDAQAVANLPVGLGSGYRWVDLDGEGLSGILTEQSGAWFYKRNLGTGPTGPQFGPAQSVASRPSIGELNEGRQQLIDVQGNGALDLVDLHQPLAGFHERDVQQGWSRFVPFERLPNIDWNDPNVRFVDLTGDGHADALITECEVVTWYPSRAEKGFGEVERNVTPLDESDGPRIIFADGEQAVYLADMSGDGLADIIRVRNGQVCYWPNLGYGRFGRQIIMDSPPWFDHPEQFDQRRVRLADIDGSGTTDLIYLGRRGTSVWFNRSGNAWSAPRQLPFPTVAGNAEQIQVADLLGNGTACLVWSSDWPTDGRRPMRYLDLMGGRKPHLMVEMRNNLGTVTTVDYAASTKFYLADRVAGTPWATRLPFPVHCAEKVTVTDLRRKTTFATTYSYHHGYFDGIEREFRGFGRVEQLDTQRFDDVAAANLDSPYVTADQQLYQPPVKTITWFHTGLGADWERAFGIYEGEYFPSRYASRLTGGGFAEHELSQPEIETVNGEMTADEWREAMRACKSMILRQEVVELDVDSLADHAVHKPVRLFSAAQHNCHVRLVQHRGPNQHAVFLVTESEVITYQYELSLCGEDLLTPDPRVAHALNLRWDDYGRTTQSVAAVYPRRLRYVSPRDDPAPLEPTQIGLIDQVQGESHLVYTEARFTDELPAELDTHRLPMQCEFRTFELTDIKAALGSDYYTITRLRDHQFNPALDTQATIAVGSLDYHEQPPNATPHQRLVEHVLTLYFDDDLTGPLDVGTPSRFGLVYETYKLAITTGLLESALRSGASDDDFAGEAVMALAAPALRSGYFSSGYQTDAGIFHPAAALPAAAAWWMRSGSAGFAADAALHFYLPERYVDPFGNETTLRYDPNNLFVESIVDPVGNSASVARFDSRVLAPAQLIDRNDNISDIAFDIRGLPVATAVRGKVTVAGSDTGDTVSTLSFDDLNPATTDVAAFFLSASLDDTQARTWLGQATTRFVYHFGEIHDLGALLWGATAAGACSIARELHVRDAGNAADLQLAFEYLDGSGTPFVRKVQAESNPSITGGPLRWIANGKTVINNKGKSVLEYEPYFSASGHRFDAPIAEGVTAIMFYDAPGRLVRTEFPDGTMSRVEFTPWLSRSYDRNDTVLEPNNHWYTERSAATADPDGKRAARLSSLHANTPAEVHLDSLGRDVVTIAHNRTPSDAAVYSNTPLADRPWLDERILTFTKLDAEGKPLWIRDARHNLVVQYFVPALPDNAAIDVLPAGTVPGYDIAGNLLFQHSMDAGDRRLLADAAGQPLLSWDYNERTDATTTTVFNEHRRFETGYDPLHRPAERILRVRDDNTGVTEKFVVERFRYGEEAPDNKAANLRGEPWQHYDGSGLQQTDAFDLGRKPLVSRTRLASEVEAAAIDWNGRAIDDINIATASGFDGDVLTQGTQYDALGRVTRHYNWHVESPPGSGNSERVAVYLPHYNARGLLVDESLLVRARKTPTGHDVVAGTTVTQQAITRVTYNAKGNKLSLELGNGTSTRYTYSPDTFRLQHLYTRRDATFANDCAGNPDATRPARPCGVQNLHYVYDPAGNITHIQDDAQQTIWFANQQVEPSSDFMYDAIYRLIEGTGRENAAAIGAPAQPEGSWPSAAFPASDATRIYTERYRYDQVGNIERMQHLAPNIAGQSGSWTRYYTPFPGSNQLWRTWYGDPDWTSNSAIDKTEYGYDRHGSMLNLADGPARFDIRWDANDMIHTIDLGGGGRAWYQYSADKQRCRKRLVRNPAVNGTIREERVYLTGYERYLRYTGDPNDPVEDIESHHLLIGGQRVLLIDDVLKARNPRPDGLTVKAVTLWRYQYGNQLGSVSAELDDMAKVISHEEYHPYGTTAYRLLATDSEAPASRYRYTGLERDDESGMSYHGARYYMCTHGRWVSYDPAGLADSLCPYEYVRSNPIRYRDTSGRFLNEGIAAEGTATVATGEATTGGIALGGVGVPAAGVGLILLAVLAVPAILYLAHIGGKETSRRLEAEAKVGHERYLRSIQQEQYRGPSPTAEGIALRAKLLGEDPKRAQEEFRRRRIEAENLVEDGVLTRREADEYIRTGIRQPEEARDRRSGGVNFRLRASAAAFARYDAIPTGDTVVYTIRGHRGEVLYVGITAKTQGPDNPGGREAIHRLLEHLATKVGEFIGEASEFVVEGSYELEREAHALEHELIKEHDPKYNVDVDPYGTYQSGHPKAQLPKWADPELDPVNVPGPNLGIRIGIEVR